MKLRDIAMAALVSLWLFAVFFDEQGNNHGLGVSVGVLAGMWSLDVEERWSQRGRNR